MAVGGWGRIVDWPTDAPALPKLKILDLSDFESVIPPLLSPIFPNLEVLLVDSQVCEGEWARLEHDIAMLSRLRRVELSLNSDAPKFFGPPECRVDLTMYLHGDSTEEVGIDPMSEIPASLAVHLETVTLYFLSVYDVNYNLNLGDFSSCVFLKSIEIDLSESCDLEGLRITGLVSLPAATEWVFIRLGSLFEGDRESGLPCVQLAHGWVSAREPLGIRFTRVSK